MDQIVEQRNVAMLVAAAMVALALASFVFRDIIIFNGSRSMPIGLYLRQADADIGVGSVVTARAASVSPEYAAARAFIDPNDRFIKRVAAAAGDEVCAEGQEVRINGRAAATRAFQDSAGRTLPRWRGCVTLAEDEFFLLGESPDSFDSRYWGPIERQDIEGVWRPL